MLIGIIFISFIFILFFIIILNKSKNDNKNKFKNNSTKQNLDTNNNCNYNHKNLFDNINVCEDINNNYYYCIPQNNKIILKCENCYNKLEKCPIEKEDQSKYYTRDICPLLPFEKERCCKDNNGYYTGQICEKGTISGHYSTIYKYCSCE